MEISTNVNPLGSEKIEKLMVRFCVPGIISIVVNSLYSMVDQIFIGQGVGYLGNAATNVLMPFSVIILALCLMVGDGAAAFMSLSLGKKDKDSAAYGVGNAVTMIIGIGTSLMVLCEIFIRPLCSLFGATENVMPYAVDYGRIIILGFPFSAICCGFGAIIRADGRPKSSMIGLLIGCAVNMVLDPLFVLVFQWGVKGAAWATIIGQFLNAVWFISCLFRFNTIKLKKIHFFPKVKMVLKILSLGTSSLITQIAAVVVITVMNRLLVKYGAQSKYGGDIPLAATGITMKISQLIAGIAGGIASGIQPIIGFNYGSEQYSRVKKTYKTALCSAMLVLAAGFILFQSFPELLISLFGQESELYVEFAVKSLRIYTAVCFMIPATTVTGICFQAIGKPLMASVLSMSRQVLLLIPAMLLFGWLWGVEGVLWATPFADGLAGVISLAIMVWNWKKIFKEKVQHG